MKELINRITITGELVKNDLKEFKTNNGEEAIGGDLILRTADGSEHQVNFFSYKYKKDNNGNFTSETTYFYEKYLEAIETLKDSEHCGEGERPDIISITDGCFVTNDYKGQNGDVISTNRISARFINRVQPKDYETTVLEAKFEVEGIIASIEDEIVKNVPTGNLVVTLNAIRQRQTDYTKNESYEADSLVPIKMIVDKSMANAFRSAGYYEGAFTKFIGVLVNTVEFIKTIEKQNFGEDVERVVKNYVRKNEIKSGSAVSTIFEHELTQEIVDMLIAQRKQTLYEIKNGIKKNNNSNVSESTPAPKINYNPFAQIN